MWIYGITARLELRHRHGDGLRVAVANANIDRFNAGLLSGGGGGAVKLKISR